MNAMCRLSLLIVFGLSITGPSCAGELPVVAFGAGVDRLTITIGEKPFTAYVYTDPVIPRPFFCQVHAPSGTQVTRNYPVQPGVDLTDHPTYHPGIWLAFGDLDGADSWRVKAWVRHDRFVDEPKGGPGLGTFTVERSYLTPDGGRVICQERCGYTIAVRPLGYLIVADSLFESRDADFAFGDQEEMGLGVRLATPLAVMNGGRIRNSGGQVNEAGVWGKTAAWCDYSGKIGGENLGVTLFPDPANFRSSWFHARDYGLMTANPFGRHAMTRGAVSRVVVKKGERFRLRFGILVHGTKEAQEYDPRAAYQDYLDHFQSASR